MSPLAASDLDDLRAEGLAPTDEDVLRLHALGSRISASGETNAYTMPRMARVGGYLFHEPTMAAQYWFNHAKRYAEDEETEDWLFAFACVYGRDHRRLSALTDPSEIERELGLFIGNFTATRAEMLNALYYVTVGRELVIPEQTELAKKRQAEAERENYSVLEKTLAEAAVSTGLSFADMMEQTPSRLVGMIYAAHVQAGIPMERSSAKAHAEYLATLNAIRARLQKKKDSKEKRPAAE